MSTTTITTTTTNTTTDGLRAKFLVPATTN